MKILVVMKRFGAGKDMVLSNFGRQIRLFEPLAKRHKVDFLCPDYTKKEKRTVIKKSIRYLIVPVGIFSIFSFVSSFKKIIKNGQYDLIVASTDPLIGILCHTYSKKHGIPLLYDLQDNFESYSAYRIPLVGYFDRKVMKNAEFVIAVSESLKKHVSRLRKKQIYVIPNGIDLRLFSSMDKAYARKKLGLPLDAKIIVYIGHVGRIRGWDMIFSAFSKVKVSIPDTFLLLSGNVDGGIDVDKPNIIFREFPERNDVVLGINSADVAVMPNPLNKFTRYCFPYKLVEYMACKVPIVATDVGDVSKMLSGFPDSLCRPGDVDSMHRLILKKLKKPSRVNYDPIVKNLKWELLADKLEIIISK